MRLSEAREGSGKPAPRRRRPAVGGGSAPDRQTTPQSLGNDAAEGIGGAFPIVGIGMSAGGLEVATAFLNAMPPDSGMGFVIVQHLDSAGKVPKIEIDWTESRGPPVQEPARRGQGTRFIERSIAYELKGKSSVTFAQDGLHATLVFPMKPAIMPTGAPVPPEAHFV